MSYVGWKYQNARLRCQPTAIHWVDGLLAIISSWRCVLCLQPAQGMDLCMGCLDDLPWLGVGCRHCALPLPDESTAVCGRCARSGKLQDIDICVAALAYEFPVDRLITALKYIRKIEYARVLGELLAIRVHELAQTEGYALPDMVVAVPLHPWRLLQRSFNQAAEITRWVAYEHHLPVNAALIRRVRHTPGQAGLKRSARLSNLHDAFSLTADVTNLRIALVDDVVTTAATIHALARLLKHSGAAEVQVWAVARAIV
jgi:ComF family protein